MPKVKVRDLDNHHFHQIHQIRLRAQSDAALGVATGRGQGLPRVESAGPAAGPDGALLRGLRGERPRGGGMAVRQFAGRERQAGRQVPGEPECVRGGRLRDPAARRVLGQRGTARAWRGG
jgi:hypothetical protein